MRKFGALRLLGPADESDLRTAIRHLADSPAEADQHSAAVWRALYRDLALNRILRDFDEPLPSSTRDYIASGEFPPEIARLADVALVGESVPAGLDALRLPRPTSAEEFDQLRVFRNFAELASEPTIPVGTSREDIWDDRLDTAARLSTDVWIRDPYLFGERAFDENEAQMRLAHVNWLLRKLAGTLIEHNGLTPAVHILTAAGEYDVNLVARFLAGTIAECQWVGTLEITLYTPSQKFKPHDRHIRFSCGVAFDVPAGFDRLGDGWVKDDEGYKWHYISVGKSYNGLAAVEQDITDRGTTRTLRNGSWS